jgi:prepilin-type N-terminal cleavage/methylation domain-containing protein
MKFRHPCRQGFTLLEISIVAVILMLLATMAVPAFQDTITDAEVASTRSMLARMRTAVDFYAFQHREDLPGESGGLWSESTFDAQLRQASDIDGNTAAAGSPGYPYGPYLNEAIPANPFNGLASIAMVPAGGSFSGPDNTTGWVYWADTGTIRANSTELCPGGEPIYDL